jgi:uncharacterized protein (UPF0212 family)
VESTSVVTPTNVTNTSVTNVVMPRNVVTFYHKYWVIHLRLGHCYICGTKYVIIFVVITTLVTGLLLHLRVLSHLCELSPKWILEDLTLDIM